MRDPSCPLKPKTVTVLHPATARHGQFISSPIANEEEGPPINEVKRDTGVTANATGKPNELHVGSVGEMNHKSSTAG